MKKVVIGEERGLVRLITSIRLRRLNVISSKVVRACSVALVNGISMGGGASLMVPMTFSVVTEKVVCGFCKSKDKYWVPHSVGSLTCFLIFLGIWENV
ncbi:hypothetical protein ACET3Z_031635 [Daucus carota]